MNVTKMLSLKNSILDSILTEYRIIFFKRSLNGNMAPNYHLPCLYAVGIFFSTDPTNFSK
jgi:hypothetical protein